MLKVLINGKIYTSEDGPIVIKFDKEFEDANGVRKYAVGVEELSDEDINNLMDTEGME